jgi:hypothetical protein
MRIKKDTAVKLKSYLGTLKPLDKLDGQEAYWRLIGTTGKVIKTDKNRPNDVLVVFHKKLIEIGIKNQNPIVNSVWIKKSDLEIDQNANYIIKLDKAISQHTGYMSNAKWFKLFKAIELNQIIIKTAKIKFLLSESEHPFHFGGFNNTGFADVSPLGPYSFKDIEKIYIPRNHELERWNQKEKLASEIMAQPLHEIEKILITLGKYEYDLNEEALIIYGYK